MEEQKYESIKKYVDSLNEKNVLKATLRKNKDGEILYILLLYKKETKLNPFTMDIHFSISLPEDFPEREPYVRCLTDFVFPTLFDNRNILYSIIQHYWISKSSEEDIVNLLKEVIEKIPKFLIKVQENVTTKTLIYYDGYVADEIYEMNDFLMNPKVKAYKIKYYYDGMKTLNKEVKDCLYLIITDLYMLIMEPAPESMNMGKLIYMKEIFEFEKREIKAVLGNEVIFKIPFRQGTNDIPVEFYLIGDEGLFDFCKMVDQKIVKLRKKFKCFIEDEFKLDDKFNESNRQLSRAYTETESLENILSAITYKEEIYKSNKTMNSLAELMHLYEKAIEMLSANGDDQYSEYLKRLKVLYQDKDQLLGEK